MFVPIPFPLFLSLLFQPVVWFIRLDVAIPQRYPNVDSCANSTGNDDAFLPLLFINTRLNMFVALYSMARTPNMCIRPLTRPPSAAFAIFIKPLQRRRSSPCLTTLYDHLFIIGMIGV